jgi:hypothetical protein
MTAKFLYRWVLIVPLALLTPLSEATSPCRVEGGCIDEVSAALLGAIEVYAGKCAEADPDHAEQYRAEAQHVDADENPDFLQKLRASTIYAVTVQKIKSDADRMDRKQLVELCKHLFRPVEQGPAAQ